MEVKLPKGMNEGEFSKLFETFLNTRAATQVRDKAVRSATKDLIGNHKDEYDTILAGYMPKS